jgi:hypothetical protein
VGFNTTVFILNDQFGAIQQDPQRFVDDLHREINSGEGRYVLGQTTVMESRHAGEFRLYATRCNSIVELGPYAPETMRLVEGERFQRDFVLGMLDQAEDKIRRLREEIAKVSEESDV